MFRSLLFLFKWLLLNRHVILTIARTGKTGEKLVYAPQHVAKAKLSKLVLAMGVKLVKKDASGVPLGW